MLCGKLSKGNGEKRGLGIALGKSRILIVPKESNPKVRLYKAIIRISRVLW